MIKRWVQALFGTPRRVAVTLLYLLGFGAVGTLGSHVLGQEGSTVGHVVKWVVWALLMSPLLHPALGGRSEPPTLTHGHRVFRCRTE